MDNIRKYYADYCNITLTLILLKIKPFKCFFGKIKS